MVDRRSNAFYFTFPKLLLEIPNLVALFMISPLLVLLFPACKADVALCRGPSVSSGERYKRQTGTVKLTLKPDKFSL